VALIATEITATAMNIKDFPILNTSDFEHIPSEATAATNPNP
jgi:hypothetical protein